MIIKESDKLYNTLIKELVKSIISVKIKTFLPSLSLSNLQRLLPDQAYTYKKEQRYNYQKFVMVMTIKSILMSDQYIAIV
jgi:hypothetical protein